MRPKLLFFPFALIIFVWSFVSLTKPAWSDYQSGKEGLKKLDTEKQTLIRGVSNIKKALAEFNQLGEDIKKRVYNAMPESVDNDNLVAEINKGASQSGVVVVKVGTKKALNRNIAKCNTQSSSNSSRAKTDCSITAIPITLTMSVIGSYSMVKDFLSKLDVQNRVIVPQNFSLAIANNQNNEDEENRGVIDLINSKIVFDVFQKKSNSKIVLSKAIDNDKVLKSLLSKGLDKKGLQALQDMITSEIFYPITVNGVGRENLFKQTTEAVETVQ